MTPSDYYEDDSFEAFIRFYEDELRMIGEGRHNAVKDFTASFRRSLRGHGVVVVRKGLPYVLTPRAEATLARIGGL